ncbi:hypothetical protein B0H11DRAFT_863444 [Mycena galericulata]|nr:hypothetical protein B0H11DRAFT_863444 [Mycena galericulata]
MPAIRRTRREGRDHTAAPGLGSSAPAPASSSSSSSLFSSLPFPFPSSSSDGAGGYSTDTTPFFLRRPHQQSKTSARTDDIVQRGREASGLLGSIGNSMNMETVQIVATSAALLFDVVQTVRTNKTRCIQLLERVHQIVRTIINLLGEASGKGGDSVDGVGTGNSALPPLMLRAIDRFSETLTTLHTALTAQAAHGLLARILRHAETRDQLAQCERGLGEAMELFSVQTALISHASLGGLRRAAGARHAEVLRALGR